MNITCPACKTTFLLREKQTNKKINLKCSRCGNIWCLTNINISYKLFYILYGSLIGLILFSLFIFLNSYLPFKRTLSQDLYFKNVKWDYKETENKLVLRYVIANSSEKLIHPSPLVRIRLYNSQGQIIKQHLLQDSDTIINKKNYINIRTDFDFVPKEVSKVDLAIGSRWDFCLR